MKIDADSGSTVGKSNSQDNLHTNLSNYFFEIRLEWVYELHADREHNSFIDETGKCQVLQDRAERSQPSLGGLSSQTNYHLHDHY